MAGVMRRRHARLEFPSMNIRIVLKLLDRTPRAASWSVAVLLVLSIGVFDYLTGFEISFAFFYLIPVSLAALALGRRAGLAVSVFCAVIWIVANLYAGQAVSSPFVPLWNVCARAAVFYVVAYLLAELRQLLNHERSLAHTDFITGALNSRAFYDLVAAETARSVRHTLSFTILYFDIDNFKAVNDRLGHNRGDQLLRAVVETIAWHIREMDSVARLGGDEFAVLLPETDTAAARVVVPRLHEALLSSMSGTECPVTFSIGVLTCREVRVDTQELIRSADRLMYSMKAAGKNAIGYATFGALDGPGDPDTIRKEHV